VLDLLHLCPTFFAYMPTLTCVLVDDEPPARALLEEYLAPLPDVTVAGTCGTGAEAIRLIERARPDFAILDIEMPGLDGFDGIERVEVLPYVIFATAYNEYAIDAFDAGAVDYLLKPYGPERLEKAVQRVRDRLTAEDSHQAANDHGDALARVLQQMRAQSASASAVQDQLYVRHGEKIVPVDPASVLWVEAAGDYATLHTEDGDFLSSMGLGALTEHLDPHRFMRIHRSHVVALPAIDHLRSDGSGGYVARLSDGTNLRVSRSYAPEIRDRIV